MGTLINSTATWSDSKTALTSVQFIVLTLFSLKFGRVEKELNRSASAFRIESLTKEISVIDKLLPLVSCLRFAKLLYLDSKSDLSFCEIMFLIKRFDSSAIAFVARILS